MRALGFLLVLTLVTGTGLAAAATSGAETFGYPGANAAPYRPDAPNFEWWVDENGDGRVQPADEVISGRGYYYRNDTDFVAWKLQSMGVAAAKTRDLHDAGVWASTAVGRAGITIRTTAVRYAVAVRVGSPGRVAFIDDVLPDGRITVSEYNAGGGGTGRTWTGTPASRGFTKYLDFGITASREHGSPVAIARNADGRLEIFGLASAGAVFHQWQVTTGGYWSTWSRFEGTLTAVAAESNADGRLEAFGIGPNGALLHKWQRTPSGAWTPWVEMDRKLTSVAAARNKDGRLEVFGTSSSHVLCHQWQSTPGGQWSGWSKFEGTLANVAAETNADGRMEIFAVRTNGTVVHKWQLTPGGVWSAWAELSGELVGIALTRNKDGRLEAFGTDSAHRVSHKWQLTPGGEWTGWSLFDGTISSVAAETNTGGRIELIGVGPNGAVFRKGQQTPGAAWSPWVQVEGGLHP